jgi:antitoxin CptB
MTHPASSATVAPEARRSTDIDACGVSIGQNATRLARIRWRCRRGMLENDIILARYLDARGSHLDESEIAQLDLLLELPDNELWDLVAGRAQPTNRALQPLVDALRDA